MLDVAGAHSVRSEAQDLPLALRERIGLAPCFRRKIAIDDTQPAVNASYGIGQLRDGSRL
jgi:hypothetical protein